MERDHSRPFAAIRFCGRFGKDLHGVTDCDWPCLPLALVEGRCLVVVLDPGLQGNDVTLWVRETSSGALAGKGALWITFTLWLFGLGTGPLTKRPEGTGNGWLPVVCLVLLELGPSVSCSGSGLVTAGDFISSGAVSVASKVATFGGWCDSSGTYLTERGLAVISKLRLPSSGSMLPPNCTI